MLIDRGDRCWNLLTEDQPVYPTQAESLKGLIDWATTAKESFKAQINEDLGTGHTHLFYYARSGYNHCVRFLLENGANPNHINDYGYTPLFFAVSVFDNVSTIGLLVVHGADVAYCNKGESIIDYARKFKMSKSIKYLEDMYEQGFKLKG